MNFQMQSKNIEDTQIEEKNTQDIVSYRFLLVHLFLFKLNAKEKCNRNLKKQFNYYAT